MMNTLNIVTCIYLIFILIWNQQPKSNFKIATFACIVSSQLLVKLR